MFFINSVLLGVALAMDAFSVCIANALQEPNMRRFRSYAMASVYAFFQFAMPMIGWLCVHLILSIFTKFQFFIPWIALVLLLYLGIKMIVESFSSEEEDIDYKASFSVLLLQGLATSIDALSVGFTISDYKLNEALLASLIIALVTFVICKIGLKIGHKVGEKLSSKAEILGGIILIGIGLEIFITGIF